jgi:hypothetical protein
MFWAYTICSKRTRESQNASSFSRVMLEEREIFDYFTHFEFLETRALYDFYADIALIATNEFKKKNIPVDRALTFSQK